MKIKNLLMILGASTISLSANAQLAEGLGIATVPLNEIEGNPNSTNSLTEKAVDIAKSGIDFVQSQANNLQSGNVLGVDVSQSAGGFGGGIGGGLNSNNTDNSSSDNTKNLATAGAIGAGAYALAQSEAGKALMEAGQSLATNGVEAVKGAEKALAVSSDALGMATGSSSPPPVTLLFGPTPTGDVFSFCNGPRPSRKSRWFSPYVYLCDGNPKKPGAAFIGFGVK